MRKIILYMLMTLDGFIAGPQGEFDDFEPSRDEHEFANKLFASMDSVVFGRTTYEGFVGYWDAIDLTDDSLPRQEADFARIFRGLERIVVSRSVSVDADNTIVVRDALAARMRELKMRPGRDMLLVCGPELLGEMMQHALVDECILLIKPRALGQGKSLFGELRKKALFRLIETQEFSSGTVLHRYGCQER